MIHDHRGFKNPFYGRKHSEKTKRLLSKIHKKKPINWNAIEAMREATRGKPLSEEHKKKLSESKKGRVFTKEHRLKLAEAKLGKKQSMKTRLKRSKSMKKVWQNPAHIAKLTGENAPNWKGGLSFEEYCPIWKDREFKEFIIDRDKHQCQSPFCYGESESLTIHHIDYKKKICKPMNLITLCVSCNVRANFGRREWISIFRTVMEERFQNGREHRCSSECGA